MLRKASRLISSPAPMLLAALLWCLAAGLAAAQDQAEPAKSAISQDSAAAQAPAAPVEGPQSAAATPRSGNNALADESAARDARSEPPSATPTSANSAGAADSTAPSPAKDVIWSGEATRTEPPAEAVQDEYAKPATGTGPAAPDPTPSSDDAAPSAESPTPAIPATAAPTDFAAPDNAASGQAPETTATLPDGKPAAPASPAPLSETPASSEPDSSAATPDDSIPPSPAEIPGEPSGASPENPAAAPASAAPAASPQAPTAASTPAAPSFADLVKSALDALVKTQSTGGQAAELRKERVAIAAYYAARDDAPLWIENGKPTGAVHLVMDRLAHAGDDGLDLEGLPVPVFEGGDDKLAAAEVALSAEVVAYGRQASGSRVDPQMISDLIGAKPDLPDPALILAAVAAAGDEGGAVLQSFNPPQKQYGALREKLAQLRSEATPVAGAPIPMGRSLRIGMRDPRVPLIRARFGLDPGPGGASDLLYDTRTAAAVADFQKANGLPASGVLTARTIATLSEPSRLDNEIIANMERWRWMPRIMGDSRIDVNIPDFMVTVTQDGEVVSRNKVIVGKPDTPTPVFSNTMKFLIVNPYWYVPPSIVRKEMLPRLAGDPSYLSEMGFEVSTRHGQLIVRQPPGERNALGRIKFMFPNQYSVYLHDTPSRGLFAAARRAFSHGCVRVDQPFGFAESVLGPGWPEARIKRLIGGDERYVYLPKPLPIHIEYFTAYVDDSGRLQLRDDIYDYSHKVKVALGLEKADGRDAEQVSDDADPEQAPLRWRRKSILGYGIKPNEFAPVIAGHP
jgi:L,D-transpeptidase YcbB